MSSMSTRLSSLDLIRGFAILGILFMNIYAFMLPTTALITPNWQGADESSLTDQLIFSVQAIFMQGRFYSLFALLFGAGLVLLQEKWQANGLVDANARIRKRLRWLLVFALIHAVFIWSGDILFSYAVVGLLIYNAHTKSSEQLFKRGLLFFIIGHVFLLALWLAFPWLEEVMPDTFANHEGLLLSTLANEKYAWTLPYGTQVLENITLSILMYVLGAISFWWEVAGLMLIGMGLYKTKVFQQGFSHQQALLFLLLGLLIASFDLAYQWKNDFNDPRQHVAFFYTIPALPMALFYIHLLVHWVKKNPHVLKPIQNVGRMAFTLYIFQSLTMVILFRWVWPEGFATYERLACLYWALGLSVLQIILANLWLHYFKQGPLEWLWRYLVLMSDKDVSKSMSCGHRH